MIQRFGGSINLHLHVHALALDEVFGRTSTGRLVFHAVPPPSATDVAEILTTVVAGVRRLVARDDLEEDGAADPAADASLLVAGWAAAPVQPLVRQIRA